MYVCMYVCIYLCLAPADRVIDTLNFPASHLLCGGGLYAMEGSIILKQTLFLLILLTCDLLFLVSPHFSQTFEQVRNRV